MKCYSKPSIEIVKFQFEKVLADGTIDIDGKVESFIVPFTNSQPTFDGESVDFIFE